MRGRKRKKSYYIVMTLLTICLLFNIGSRVSLGTPKIVLSVLADIALIASVVVSLCFGT